MPNRLDEFFELHPNFSTNTQTTYRSILAQFQRFLKNKSWHQINAHDITRFLATKNKGTQKNYLEVIRRFLRWLYDDELPKPIRRLTVKYQRKRIRPSDLPTLDEIQVPINSMPTLREKTIIAMLYGTGARTSELLYAKVKDIEEIDGEQCLGVNGKPGRR